MIKDDVHQFSFEGITHFIIELKEILMPSSELSSL